MAATSVQATEERTAPRRAPSRDRFIEFDGVTKRYQARHGSTLALSDVSVSVGRKELVVLIGQSGCGKTTMLRILAGLIRPSEGDVRVEGRSLWRGERRDDEALAKLGLVFQDP